MRKAFFILLLWAAAFLANAAFCADNDSARETQHADVSRAISDDLNKSALADVNKSTNPSAHDATEQVKAHAQSAREGVYVVVRYIETHVPAVGSFLGRKVCGMYVGGLIAGAAVFLAAFFAQRFLTRIVLKFAERLFSRSGARGTAALLERLRKPVGAWIVFTGAYVASLIIVPSADVVFVIGRVYFGVLWIFLFWIVWVLSDALFAVFDKKLSPRRDGSANILEFSRRFFRIALVFVAVLLVLDLCGVNVGAIMASLGIGGAALAFASKDTIANFFGSVSLVADKPFVVGDWIVAGNIEGNVEAIGIRSTRIRTFQKTLVSVPNSVLANLEINNMSKMPCRKDVITLGLTYATTADQIIKVVDALKELLRRNVDISPDGINVTFTEFADSSLNIRVTYYAKSTDYSEFMRIKQDVNISIMRLVADMGLSFAFPSTSVYIESQK